MISSVISFLSGNINNPVKQVSKVLLLVSACWLIAQWLGSSFGWDYRLVFLFDIIAFLGFIPLALILSKTKMYFPLFPLIEPIAQDLTPYLFPIYLLITNASEYMFGNFSYVY